MQNDPNSLPPIRQRPNKTRLVGMSNEHYYKQENVDANDAAINDIVIQPTVTMQSVASPDSVPPVPNGHSQFQSVHPVSSHPGSSDGDISTQSTMHLMQLSGMMRAVRLPQNGADGHAAGGSSAAIADLEEGYWPYGIQRTGPFPVVNLYGAEPFGRTLPLAAVTMPVAPQQEKQQPKWKTLLNAPAVKVTLGLLVGIGLLFLVSRFVDL